MAQAIVMVRVVLRVLPMSLHRFPCHLFVDSAILHNLDLDMTKDLTVTLSQTLFRLLGYRQFRPNQPAQRMILAKFVSIYRCIGSKTCLGLQWLTLSDFVAISGNLSGCTMRLFLGFRCRNKHLDFCDVTLVFANVCNHCTLNGLSHTFIFLVLSFYSNVLYFWNYFPSLIHA
ncbi:expressed protein [Batrachochytrium dendrobatidis JAM81]|uniref:Expressed protein n=1 Tax=Batrachochytrium dendrobatidis (strain JAM81 / FGSC 10211) TaxID=684364 RepID=F4P5Y9_BATDJ|nr:uncharacterized protein BATDEDRAFT_37122 [Batrachochytrium dendrobatidis JAM81]EGF79262.1 expressed protein [Batrachochytrium dendrobatidis JAM81]|eukprot:XP_006680024.1 expressed protein [Batrachochytrium dendrobatidis JAM81]